MEDINLSFLLYFVDTREAADVAALVERAFQCHLKPADVDVPLEEKIGLFEGESLGMSISFERGEEWPSGHLYRLNGATHRRKYSSTGTRVVINGHIARTLEGVGISRVMTREELSALDQKK